MATPTEIIRRLPTDRFVDLLAASPKAFRENLFRQSNVKVKGNAFAINAASKNVVRSERLHRAIVDGLDLGDQALEELIRNYLYTRRDLLAAALDNLGVAHDNGLTDEDLEFLKALPAERIDALRAALVERFDPTDVSLYLDFMQIPA